MSTRKREVIAWRESVITTTSNRKIRARAADHLVQQQIRDLCCKVSSVSVLTSITISFGIIDSWQKSQNKAYLTVGVLNVNKQIKAGLQFLTSYAVG